MAPDRPSSSRSEPARRAELPFDLATDHPLALVSAARLALRRAGKGREEIDRFTRSALSSPDPRSACSPYVRLRR